MSTDTTNIEPTELVNVNQDVSQKAFFGNKNQLRHRPFLVITLAALPAKDSKTHMSGWGANRNSWNISEDAKILDNISSNIMRNATFIIDIVNGIVVRNAKAQTFDDQKVLAHFMQKYSNEITQGLSRWLHSDAPIPTVSQPKEI